MRFTLCRSMWGFFQHPFARTAMAIVLMSSNVVVQRNVIDCHCKFMLALASIAARAGTRVVMASLPDASRKLAHCRHDSACRWPTMRLPGKRSLSRWLLYEVALQLVMRLSTPPAATK